MNGYPVLQRLLSDRPIAFHPELARAFGGINEALFFQQIAYWMDKGSDPDWIYKTREELQSEICLTRHQQDLARKNLRALGVVQEARRGVPARLYYRIDWERVFEVLDGNRHPRMPETGNQACRERPDQNAGKQPTSKSTAENTKETAFERYERYRKRTAEARRLGMPY